MTIDKPLILDPQLADPTDPTKLIDWDITALTPAAAKTITMPDQDIDLTPGSGSYVAKDTAMLLDGSLAMTGDMDLGAFDIRNITELQFAGGAGTAGTLSWNTDEETLDLIQNGAVLQIGQEMHYHARNNTGFSIGDGVAVMSTGTLGASGRITVDEMVNDYSIEPYMFMGITTESIGASEDGKVTHFGKVRGLDTSGGAEAWVDGQLLYLSPTTPGALTKIQPAAPAHRAPVAIVIHAHASSGTLFVRAMNNEGLHELHDVQITTPANKDFIWYSTANTRWENVNASAISLTEFSGEGNYLLIDGTRAMTGNLNLGNNDLVNPGAGHDAFTDYVANEHIDWTAASENLVTSGSGEFAGSVSIKGKGVDDGYIRFYESTNNYYSYVYADTLTANRFLTLPNATGTIALTSDIPTNVSELANDVPYVSMTGATANGVLTYNTAGDATVESTLTYNGFLKQSDTLGLSDSTTIQVEDTGGQSAYFGVYRYSGGGRYINISADVPDGSNYNLLGSTTDTFVNAPSASGSILFRINNVTKALISSAGVITDGASGTSTQWNTAYGWGDHSVAGYVDTSGLTTGYIPYATDSDTLADSSLYRQSADVVNVGTTQTYSWDANHTVIQGVNSAIKLNTTTTPGFGFVVNAYYDTGWKYMTTSHEAMMMDAYNNNIQFRIAGTGTAGSLISWSTPLQINQSSVAVTGTLSVSSMTGTATSLTGATSSNVLTDVTIGSGLSLSSGTLSATTTGTIGGSISSTQIAYGSGSDTIAGESNFTWTTGTGANNRSLDIVGDNGGENGQINISNTNGILQLGISTATADGQNADLPSIKTGGLAATDGFVIAAQTTTDTGTVPVMQFSSAVNAATLTNRPAFAWYRGNNTVAYDKIAQLSAGGQLQLTNYTGATMDASITKGLGVDISGNVVTYTAGTIGGSISDNQIAVGAATSNEIEGNSSFTWNSISGMVYTTSIAPQNAGYQVYQTVYGDGDIRMTVDTGYMEVRGSTSSNGAFMRTWGSSSSSASEIHFGVGITNHTVVDINGDWDFQGNILSNISELTTTDFVEAFKASNNSTVMFNDSVTTSGGSSSHNILGFNLTGTTKNALVLASTATDSGTVPALGFVAKHSTDIALISRPLFGWWNHTTKLAEVDVNGDWDFQANRIQNAEVRVINSADPSALADPQNGLIAYDTTDNQLQAYINGSWTDIGGGGGGNPLTADLDTADYDLYSTTNTSFLGLYGGSKSTTRAGTILLYGGAHATLAGDVRIESGVGDTYILIDQSLDSITLGANGSGIFTLNDTVGINLSAGGFQIDGTDVITSSREVKGTLRSDYSVTLFSTNATETISALNKVYVVTAVTTTINLPAGGGTAGQWVIIKNRSSNDVTVSKNTGDQLYTWQAVDSTTVGSGGESIKLISDGTYWNEV